MFPSIRRKLRFAAGHDPAPHQAVVVAVLPDGPDAPPIAARAAVQARRRGARLVLAVPVRALAGLTTDPAVLLAGYRRQAIEAAAIAARAEPTLAAHGVRADVAPLPVRGARWSSRASARLLALAVHAAPHGEITLVLPQALATAVGVRTPRGRSSPVQVLAVPPAACTAGGLNGVAAAEPVPASAG